MRTVDIEAAKAHLSRLVEQASKGEAFIIARSGEPLVKVVPLDEMDHKAGQRLGFMAGEIQVPDDFDRMGAGRIEALFSGQQEGEPPAG